MLTPTDIEFIERMHREYASLTRRWRDAAPYSQETANLAATFKARDSVLGNAVVGGLFGRMLAHISGVTEAHAPAADRWEYHWLVELFHRGDGAPSLGRYHTGFTDISHQSRSTTQAHEARRYMKEQAERVAKDLNLHMMACEWRAVEHGFLVAADGVGVDRYQVVCPDTPMPGKEQK